MGKAAPHRMSSVSSNVCDVDNIVSLPLADPSDIAALQQAHQFWSSGNPPQATLLIRTKAEEGRPWAPAVLAWMLMQQGYPSLEESVDWAVRAAEAGFASQLTQTLNNVIANLPSYPQLANKLPQLLAYGLSWWSGPDLVGQAWNLLASGQADMAMRLLMTPVPLPPWAADGQLAQVVARAKERLEVMENTAETIARIQVEIQEASVRAQGAFDRATSDLETKAGQAGLLVDATTSEATNSLFKADAARNAKESKGSWVGGLVTLGAAATVAVLPVVLHYVNAGPDYTGFEQIGLHLVSTAAFATFAGVLLARARSRDHAAQRANDLSTAMGTMIAYSNQISDPAEKQRFMTTMGQVVLQAHLTAGGKAVASDESVGGMLALMNLIKSPATSSQATTT